MPIVKQRSIDYSISSEITCILSSSSTLIVPPPLSHSLSLSLSLSHSLSLSLSLSGTLLYLHFQSVLDILDDVLQKDLLLGVLPHFKILVGRDELIFSCIDNTSVLWYIKQLLTDACFYIPALMLTIFVPVRLGHYFFPLSGPVVFRTADVLFDYDVPLETILFHILVPFMAEKIHYRKITTYLLENFFKRVCRALDLIDYLSETFREGKAKRVVMVS